jgi:hypothetical protein
MKTQDNKTGSKWLGGLVLIIIVGAIIAVAGALQPTNSTNNTSTDKTSQPAKTEEKTSNKWDYEENYNKVQNGMTKAEVETAIDRKSDNCAETEAKEVSLKVESCNYGTPPDNGMISVTYENGKVTTKAKAAF